MCLWIRLQLKKLLIYYNLSISIYDADKDYNVKVYRCISGAADTKVGDTIEFVKKPDAWRTKSIQGLQPGYVYYLTFRYSSFWSWDDAIKVELKHN